MKKLLMLFGFLYFSFMLHSQNDMNQRNPGYCGFVNVGGGLACTDLAKIWGNGGGLSFTTTHGLNLNSRMFVGAGFGANFYSTLEDIQFKFYDPNSIVFIPVYADIRFNFLKRKNTPYFDLKGGYGFSTKSYFSAGTFLYPSIGISVGRFHYNLGFSLQSSKRHREEGTMEHYTSKEFDINKNGIIEEKEKEGVLKVYEYVPYTIEEKKFTIYQCSLGFGIDF